MDPAAPLACEQGSGRTGPDRPAARSGHPAAWLGPQLSPYPLNVPSLLPAAKAGCVLLLEAHIGDPTLCVVCRFTCLPWRAGGQLQGAGARGGTRTWGRALRSKPWRGAMARHPGGGVRVLAWLLPLLVAAVLLPNPAAAAGKLTDATIKGAVAEWCADAGAANAKFGAINAWDTSEVKTFSQLFRYKQEFDDNIDSWRTAAVKDIKEMFRGATKFNQTLNAWQTGAVTKINGMFSAARAFNQTINAWQTNKISAVNYLGTHGTFERASAFNQPLDKWQTSSIRT